ARFAVVCPNAQLTNAKNGMKSLRLISKKRPRLITFRTYQGATASSPPLERSRDHPSVALGRQDCLPHSQAQNFALRPQRKTPLPSCRGKKFSEGGRKATSTITRGVSV